MPIGPGGPGGRLGHRAAAARAALAALALLTASCTGSRLAGRPMPATTRPAPPASGQGGSRTSTTSTATVRPPGSIPPPLATKPGTVPVPGPRAEAVPPGAVTLGTGDDAAAVVRARPPGTAFVISGGVHHGFGVLAKQGDTFIGEPGAVLDGDNTVPDAFHAFAGPHGPAADDVVIQGAGASHRLVIRDYAGGEQHGAIHPVIETGSGQRQARGWRLTWLEVYGDHARGVTVAMGMVVQGCYVHDNGRLGIGGTGDDILVAGNDIAHNNTRHVPPNYESGGVKFSNTDNLVIENNQIHDNVGPGVWTDRDAINTTIQDNTIADNTGAGILNEISQRTIVRYNALEGNGAQSNGRAFGAGYVDSTTENVQVYGNLVADNANGITGVEGNRGSGPYGKRVLANVDVFDNTVVRSGTTGIEETNGDTAVFSRNIRFDRNHFVGGTFTWDDRAMTFPQWQSQVHGTANSFTPG